MIYKQSVGSCTRFRIIQQISWCVQFSGWSFSLLGHQSSKLIVIRSILKQPAGRASCYSCGPAGAAPGFLHRSDVLHVQSVIWISITSEEARWCCLLTPVARGGGKMEWWPQPHQIHCWRHRRLRLVDVTLERALKRTDARLWQAAAMDDAAATLTESVAHSEDSQAGSGGPAGSGFSPGGPRTADLSGDLPSLEIRQIHRASPGSTSGIGVFDCARSCCSDQQLQQRLKLSQGDVY